MEWIIEAESLSDFVDHGRYTIHTKPLVRCRECKHHCTHRCMDSMPTEICELDQTFYDANVDFCSLAERRTDE